LTLGIGFRNRIHVLLRKGQECALALPFADAVEELLQFADRSRGDVFLQEETEFIEEDEQPALSAFSVIPLAENDMPHAASWILSIAAIARHEVDMHMWHSLSSSRANVDAHIEAIRVKTFDE